MIAAVVAAISLQTPPKISTPAPGSKLRVELMNTLRKPVESQLGVKVKFKVDRLRVSEPWAFLAGDCQDSKGRPIDLRKTRLKAEAEWMDGPSVYALFWKDSKKKWTVKTFVLGPTDVAWSDWPERFGCPRELLGLPRPSAP
ncbi:MAG TPA: hypothetical protein PLO61_00335 [Fimbriimonadaceae bacterium]|nr:hypothetical protein [Fimbriimonadaceae bacterium]HRJ32344.1 hypothetical protein [Fimbriimonadaceae bacterium]